MPGQSTEPDGGTSTAAFVLQRTAALRHRPWPLAGLMLAAAALGMSAPACRDLDGAVPAGVEATAPAPLDAADYARLVETLSEPGGYFDTDNLVSNERSYQHVIGALRDRDLGGGAYLGVGPDQNFTYIAQIRPAIAFIVDIRRDNLLQHVLFKALFERASNRADYLSLLFGRPAPDPFGQWETATLEALVARVDAQPATPDGIARARRAVDAMLARLPLVVTPSDRATIHDVHGRFVAAGLDLQFHSHNRLPHPYYPTYRELLLETDRDLTPRSYLADEELFRYVKTLQARHLVIPVVGDLAGDRALAAIGELLETRRQAVSMVYASNVEFYLWQQGRFGRFVDNLRRLPWKDQGVVVRSYFNRYRLPLPQSVRGYGSTQLLQDARDLLDRQTRGGYRSYWDLVHDEASGHAAPPQAPARREDAGRARLHIPRERRAPVIASGR